MRETIYDCLMTAYFDAVQQGTAMWIEAKRSDLYDLYMNTKDPSSLDQTIEHAQMPIEVRPILGLQVRLKWQNWAYVSRVVALVDGEVELYFEWGKK